MNHMPCPLLAISKLISVLLSQKTPNDLFRDTDVLDKLERWIWALYFECGWCWGFQIRIKFLKHLPFDGHIQVVVIGFVFTRLGWDGWCILFHLFKVNIIDLCFSRIQRCIIPHVIWKIMKCSKKSLGCYIVNAQRYRRLWTDINFH